ncbi:MAG: hypothetical protein ABI863_10930 [Ginsengibacter sp.]
MSRYCLLIALCLCSLFIKAQSPKKQLAAQRTTSVIKIDGNLDEQAWKNATAAKDFIESRPGFGKPEDPKTKTVVYILYDNSSVYVGGYCYERAKDSISKELVGRDAEYMLSVCSGIFFMAKSGIPDGKMATTHYLAMNSLVTKYPRITALKGKRFVDNGRIITTEGIFAGIDGALYLVEKMFDKNASKDIAEYMMYNWKPESFDVYIKQ